MIAYTGRYRVEGEKQCHHQGRGGVEWKPGSAATQVRAIRFDGDRLFIEEPASAHLNIDDKTVRVIVV